MKSHDFIFIESSVIKLGMPKSSLNSHEPVNKLQKIPRFSSDKKDRPPSLNIGRVQVRETGSQDEKGLRR